MRDFCHCREPSVQQWFLPVGLCLAIILALIAPEPGRALNETGLVVGLIPLIFLVNGYQTRLAGFSFHRGLAGALLVGGTIALLVGPWLGLAGAHLFGLSAGAALGLVVMATMPPTLSSGVIMTDNAGGHTLWAMLLTIALNLAGIFTIPFMLDLTLSLGAGVEISPWPLLQRLLGIVLLPFLAGLALKRALRRPAPVTVRYIPSACIVVTVWMSMSASRETLLELALADLVLIGLGALAVHGVLLLLAYLAGLTLRLAAAERLAVLFVISQKTLPVAIGVLTALKASMASILVVCLVFHFLQLMLDSMLAVRLRLRVPAS